MYHIGTSNTTNESSSNIQTLTYGLIGGGIGLLLILALLVCAVNRKKKTRATSANKGTNNILTWDI